MSVPSLAGLLLAWYDRQGRDLPWRVKAGTADPYRVWLSEVMLQQTTVAAARPRFEAFLRRWPTLEALAGATLDEVLHEWQGLGYYNRARNLHACAQRLVLSHGGRFPRDAADLRRLPGIGPYTAGAIAAIAFGRREAAVDGNVERVIARLRRIEAPISAARADIRAAVQDLVPDDRPGDFAQALMDLGAEICIPREPRCGSCPWRGACAARAAGMQNRLPVKPARRQRPVRRAIVFWLERGDGAVLLCRRPATGLLGGMMELPSTPWRDGSWTLDEAMPAAPSDADWRLLPGVVVHVFTHFRLEAEIAVGNVVDNDSLDGVWTHPAAFWREALPTVMKKIARHALAQGRPAPDAPPHARRRT